MDHLSKPEQALTAHSDDLIHLVSTAYDLWADDRITRDSLFFEELEGIPFKVIEDVLVNHLCISENSQQWLAI